MKSELQKKVWHSLTFLLMPSVIRIGARVSAAVGPLPAECPQSGRRRHETWTGLVLASMLEKSWLIVWDQLGKSSVHPSRSLKFVEMAAMGEGDIHALRAHVSIVQPPPIHNSITLQNLQPVLRAQQNLLPIILPPAVKQNAGPVLPADQQEIPAPAQN